MKKETKSKYSKFADAWPKWLPRPKSTPPAPKGKASPAPKETGFQHAEHLSEAGVLLALLVLVAASIFLFGARGSLAPIYANSIPLKSGMTEPQIKQAISQTASSYKLALQSPDGQVDYFPLTDVGVTIDVDASTRKIKNAVSQAIIERLEWWQPINIELATKVDQSALQTFINTHATKVNSVPKDATLSIDKGVAVLTKEVAGSGSTIKNATAAVPTAIAKLQAEPLKLEESKLAPAISAKNLQASKEKLETILAQKVTFTINGKTITAGPTDIAGWVELSPVESAKTVDVTVNSGKVLQYINSIAKPHIQPPRSRLVMNTADGIVVLDPGVSGVDVVNKDKVAADVAQQVLSSQGANVDLPVNYAAAQTVEVQPHDKWVVIDVTTKRMYAYEQTNLVRTFLVSAGAPKTPTVTGQFAVYSKRRIQDMRGSNADGSRYFQPDVEYVNYFYKDYAIHGNYWRPLNYFGNVNSSHGCVGIVNADAAWLYDWAPVGTPVVIHK